MPRSARGLLRVGGATMESAGFLRVARVFDSTAAGALRAEVLAEIGRYPWWWSTWVGAAAASWWGGGPASAPSSSTFQPANIRSAWRRRLLKIPLGAHGGAIGALSHDAIRAVVRAHAERCAHPDGSPILSQDARLVELTAVVSLPGAFAQDPHADVLEDDPDHPARATDADPTPTPSRPPRPKQPPTPPPRSTILTSWVSLQAVSPRDGPTVIFPGTHARGGGPARMAPRAVRAWEGSDVSEDDAWFIRQMHADAIIRAATAADAYPSGASRDASSSAAARLERSERWWRGLLDDTSTSSSSRDSARMARANGPASSSASASCSSDTSPSLMTCDAGDMVVMDARVWHYGAAHLGRTPRVLLNVTFQDDPVGRHGDARAPTRVQGFTYHAHESVVDRYVVRDFA